MKAAQFQRLNEIEKNLYCHLASLLGYEPVIDTDGPVPFGLLARDGDVIGFGKTLAEALADSVGQLMVKRRLGLKTA